MFTSQKGLKYKIKSLLIDIRNIFLIILCISIVINILYIDPVWLGIMIGTVVIIYKIIQKLPFFPLIIGGMYFIYSNPFFTKWICMDNLDVNSLALLLAGIIVFNL